MQAKISVQTKHPETGDRIGGNDKTVGADRDAILEAISDLISGAIDHYTDTPAERRAVVEIRIEFL